MARTPTRRPRSPRTWREAAATALREREKRGSVRVEIAADQWPAFLAKARRADAQRKREFARAAEETEVLAQELFLAEIVELAPWILEELAGARDRVRDNHLTKLGLNPAAALGRALTKWKTASRLTADWALPLARRTLGLWARDPSAEHPRRWALERNRLTSERPASTRPKMIGALDKRTLERAARDLVSVQILKEPISIIAPGKIRRKTLLGFAELIGLKLAPAKRGRPKRLRTV